MRPVAATAVDQLTTPSRDIYITHITQPDGTKTQVMSVQSLCDTSTDVNSEWDGEVWQVRRKRSRDVDHRTKYIRQRCSNSGALFLLIMLCTKGNIIFRNRFMPADVWKVALGFIFGFSQLEQTEALGNYMIAIKRPSFFSTIEIDPSFASFVVDAVMRGQEDMVMNVLHANPNYLLQYAPVKNSVGVESIRSPLQAAIMANDAQMAEKMREHFARLSDGEAIMQKQILQIYTESLSRYYEKQTATERRDAYKTALNSENILDIFNAHTEAQKHNAFDFLSYVDAIIYASQEELDDVRALIEASTVEESAEVIARTGVATTQTDAARAKSFEQLTLVEKLNRFREEFTAHMQQEIIFNPNHILVGQRRYEKTWVYINHDVDPNYDMRFVIYSQLVGWTQRNAAEPVKQDIRQGAWFMTDNNKEARCRPSRFNKDSRNDYLDVSLMNSSVIDGIGYIFASSGCRGSVTTGSESFQKLCRSKIASFLNLLCDQREHTNSCH